MGTTLTQISDLKIPDIHVSTPAKFLEARKSELGKPANSVEAQEKADANAKENKREARRRIFQAEKTELMKVFREVARPIVTHVGQLVERDGRVGHSDHIGQVNINNKRFDISVDDGDGSTAHSHIEQYSSPSRIEIRLSANDDMSNLSSITINSRVNNYNVINDDVTIKMMDGPSKSIKYSSKTPSNHTATRKKNSPFKAGSELISFKADNEDGFDAHSNAEYYLAA